MILICTLLILSLLNQPHHTQRIDSLLRVLDREVSRADDYFALRERQIHERKIMLSSDPTNATHAYALTELYAPYKCDSALKYVRMAIELAGNNVPEDYRTTLVYEERVTSGGHSDYIRYPELAFTEDTHEYAISSYDRSVEAMERGDSLLRVEWLIRSSICDVRCGCSDNGSSWVLATLLAENGDVDRAYRYIDYSLTNMVRFNSSVRYNEITPVDATIRTLWKNKHQQTSQMLAAGVALLLILLVVIAVAAISTIRQNRKLHALNGKLRNMNKTLNTLNAQLQQSNSSLEESNQVKEQYITQYLVMYSENIRRMTKLARRAGEKDPEAFMQREMEEFYHSFDTTFLSLYGNFVSDFNALLREEDAIWPKRDELLCTELRIFALIRLGIDSSAKIAELLCYSPNTIYNYRAKIKNAALGDRDTFEDRVKQIQAR